MAFKVTKTSVHRFELEKTECGCKAIREFEDTRYLKPLTDGVTFLCEKHAAKSEDAQEARRESLLDMLSIKAEAEGKTYAPFRQDIEEGDTGGVTAQGESVQRMGVTGLPKRPDQKTANKPRRDPTTITQISVDRGDPRLPKAAAASASGGNLNLASVDDSDITMDGSIETVPEDPRLSGVVVAGLEGLDEALDEEDMNASGVPRSALSQAKD